MRCVACNKLLDDAEATNKRINPIGKVEYYDMCRWCLHQSHIVTGLEEDIYEQDHAPYHENGGAEDEDPYGDEIDW